MSYGEEMMADYLFERDFPYGVPGKVWHSKIGDIAVKDMSENHILNCMRIVGEDDEWYGRFLEELESRKKMVRK